jgi:hypothetical protein
MAGCGLADRVESVGELVGKDEYFPKRFAHEPETITRR